MFEQVLCEACGDGSKALTHTDEEMMEGSERSVAVT